MAHAFWVIYSGPDGECGQKNPEVICSRWGLFSSTRREDWIKSKKKTWKMVGWMLDFSGYLDKRSRRKLYVNLICLTSN
jgi:hypothetical protein